MHNSRYIFHHGYTYPISAFISYGSSFNVSSVVFVLQYLIWYKISTFLKIQASPSHFCVAAMAFSKHQSNVISLISRTMVQWVFLLLMMAVLQNQTTVAAAHM